MYSIDKIITRPSFVASYQIAKKHIDQVIQKIRETVYTVFYLLEASWAYLNERKDKLEIEISDPQEIRQIQPLWVLSYDDTASMLQNMKVYAHQRAHLEIEPKDAVQAQTQKEINALREQLNFKGQLNLIPYISQIIKTDPKDDDILVFKNSKIKISKESSEDLESHQILRLLLQETYGFELAEGIAIRYQLDERFPLRWRDLKQILIGIAANATVSDLKNLYMQIKEGRDGLLCGRSLTVEEKASFLATESFEKLSPIQISYLESAFRTIPFGTGSRIPMTALVKLNKPNHSPNLGFNYFDAFEHDYLLLKSCEDFQIDQNYSELSLSEFLSKELAYRELKKGIVIPILKTNNTYQYYTVKNQIEEKGLVAALMVPIHTSSADEESQDIYFNFRGTQLQPNRREAINSLARDLDPSGVGRQVFEKVKPSLLRQLRKHLIETNSRSINLHINGHSLGSVDAQRLLAALVAEMVEAGYGPNEFNKLKNIKIYGHNPIGVEHSLNNEFAKYLSQLKEIRRESPLSIELSMVQVAWDFIQTAGEVYLGAGIPDGDHFFKKQVFVIYSALRNFMRSHTFKPFVKRQACRVRIFDKDHNPDKMENYFQQTKLGKYINSFLYYLKIPAFHSARRASHHPLFTRSVRAINSQKKNLKYDPSRF